MYQKGHGLLVISPHPFWLSSVLSIKLSCKLFENSVNTPCQCRTLKIAFPSVSKFHLGGGARERKTLKVRATGPLLKTYVPLF